MDVQAIILSYLLDPQPEDKLEVWSKLKLAYFEEDYSEIYKSIDKYYSAFGYIPKFDEILIYNRKRSTDVLLTALKNQELSVDVDIFVAIEALIEQYAQEFTLKKVREYVSNIESYSLPEIKTNLAEIVFELDKKVDVEDGIYTFRDLSLFNDDNEGIIVPLGFNNEFDSSFGAAKSDLILIGGYRGSGKTVVCNNICVAQSLQGNIPLYFGIEMPASQIYRRVLGIMAEVRAEAIRTGTLTDVEKRQLAKVIASQYKNEEELIAEYDNLASFREFEELVKKRGESVDNPMFFIDDVKLTIAKIDTVIGNIKNKYGDRLKVAVVDYLNKISVADQYDWKAQVLLSNHLKEIAKKHDVVLVTPMQISDDNKVKFSKAIEDEADTSMFLEALDSGKVKFKSSKTRNNRAFTVASGVDWSTLKISPEEVTAFSNTEESDKDDLLF